MKEPPAYFESVRTDAADLWDQLERNRVLAGPWHQLFRQVQSARHVLSELLQNADDARATEASVRIEAGEFIFGHNGDDFSEEHFTSLCRFGFSNKRALHTIGFRGIGFKSVFSLGDSVRVFTPTLSVCFERSRFTEPKWFDSPSNVQDLTEIRVPLRGQRWEAEIRSNFEEWISSPLSLLFFRNIRNLRIDDCEIHWMTMDNGPVLNSEWTKFVGMSDDAFLIARSEAETFPDDALEEIKQERSLGVEEETDFPPCSIDIVLGAKGRLFVVLPTGVETKLPFACNAPFIQDPARLKIKDPETSPTNRWLLDRVGKFAAKVMMEWLQRQSSSLEERSKAYRLFPDVNRDDRSLEGVSATIVEVAFGDAIAEQSILVTNSGHLKRAKESVIIPYRLLEIWSEEQVTSLLDSSNRPAFSRYVAQNDRQKLLNWKRIEEIGKSDFLASLQTKHLPKPETWRQLMSLWAYVAPEIAGYRPRIEGRNLCLLPVQGKDVLYSAGEVVRLSEKRLLQSEADWEFLAAYLLVLNQNWPRYLADQRRLAEERQDTANKDEVDAAFAVLTAIGLGESSDASKVVSQVAAKFFGPQGMKVGDCIQLAQIAAKLDANPGDSFRFVTQDLHLRATVSEILYDEDGSIEAMLAKSWCNEHMLHRDYIQSFNSCTREEWSRWVSTGRAGLQGFISIRQRWGSLWGRKNIEAELLRRGASRGLYYPYVTEHFPIEDWDFEERHWNHWSALSNEDPRIWGRICERILAQPESYWSKAKSARISQAATTGRTQVIVNDLPPAWILRLREVPCLPDTRGFYHRPTDLLLRTPETEPFMDVEPFVDGRLDREKSRDLLTLLGVRDTPTGPDLLLDRLRALARASQPPIGEVEKWYRRLDQLMETSSTSELSDIRDAFLKEKIVLTECGTWTTLGGVFLSTDEVEVPGAEVIRVSVRHLALWRRLDVPERPTMELTIEWLKRLPSGEVLSQVDVRRVRAVLARDAVRIWNECAHWLNLAGEWAPTAHLAYSLSMQSLVRYSHLHELVKQKTADLQLLPVEIAGMAPFSLLSPLASQIDEQFHKSPSLFEGQTRPAWLRQLGEDLQRLEDDGQSETDGIRVLAASLEATVWQTVPGLELIPYIGGVPAGTPRRAEALWQERVLYVEDRPIAKVARAVCQELSRAFPGRQAIADAIKFCFERSPDVVSEYMEENFRLAPPDSNGKVIAPARAQEPIASQPESGPQVQPPVWVPVAVDYNGAAAIDPLGEGEHLGQDEPGLTDGTTLPLRERHVSRPAKLSMMERFALGIGFQKDGSDRFFHDDGSWIEKSSDSPYWERHAAGGSVVRYYWAKDHCLEHEPLQIGAEVWGLIDKFPDTYAFVLADPQERPIELVGSQLHLMKENGAIKLYPASYRVVFDATAGG